MNPNNNNIVFNFDQHFHQNFIIFQSSTLIILSSIINFISVSLRTHLKFLGLAFRSLYIMMHS